MSEHIIERTSIKDGYAWYTETVEREEIVRCKDCSLQDEFKYCERLGFKVGDYGYCAWPIRKD